MPHLTIILVITCPEPQDFMTESSNGKSLVRKRLYKSYIGMWNICQNVVLTDFWDSCGSLLLQLHCLAGFRHSRTGTEEGGACKDAIPLNYIQHDGVYPWGGSKMSVFFTRDKPFVNKTFRKASNKHLKNIL